MSDLERPHHECACGAVVWDGRLPKYTETVVCWRCGLDHSRRAPFLWVLRFAWATFTKRLLLYGPIGMWRQGFVEGLFDYRPRPGPSITPAADLRYPVRHVSYETPDPTKAPPEPITLIDGSVYERPATLRGNPT